MGQTRGNLVGALVLIALALLGSGCATTYPRQGQSGHVEWEILSYVSYGYGRALVTIALRETGGVGVVFETLNINIPGAYTMAPRQLFRHLDPHSEIRVEVSLYPQLSNNLPPYYELEFRGVDDVSTVKVTFRVYRQ
jgi:hypothetical protein